VFPSPKERLQSQKIDNNDHWDPRPWLDGLKVPILFKDLLYSSLQYNDCMEKYPAFQKSDKDNSDHDNIYLFIYFISFKRTTIIWFQLSTLTQTVILTTLARKKILIEIEANKTDTTRQISHQNQYLDKIPLDWNGKINLQDF
jgi:hypothetical protein